MKEEHLTKFNIPLTIKSLIKVSIEETYLYIIKAIYDKPTTTIRLKCEKLEAFMLNSETGQGFLLFLFLFNMVLDLLAMAIRQ